MKKLLLPVGILALFIVAGCARWKDGLSENRRQHVFTFYVATNGSDRWSGIDLSPNRQHSDGPFATLQRALKEAVALKEKHGGKWPEPVSIVLRGGMYRLEESVVLTPTLSGTANAPLVIKAYRQEKPILSAGEVIPDWTSEVIAGKECWVASIPASLTSLGNFHQLWVNGERRIRARHPNRGYLSIASLPDSSPTWEVGNKRFKFKPGDLKGWTSSTNGEAIAMTRWVDSRLPIVGIDEKENTLTSSKRSVFQLESGGLYYVENVFEALDEPGEWYVDAPAGKIFYLPVAGEKLQTFSAVAPRLQDCMRIIGDPATGKTVEYLQFRGLTFSGNEWFFPTNFGNTERHISSTPDPEIYGFAQAAFGVPGAVNAEGARNCLFENCAFRNLGSYGLQLGRGCQSNRVQSCEFLDLGAGGIRLGETVIRTNTSEQAHDNWVMDSVINDGGKVFHSGEGIWIGQSFNNRILHNRIHNFFYTGISIGWTWGYETSLATNNTVEFNDVRYIGQKANGDGPILSDMGGIYTLGNQGGTTIRDNLWRDIYGLYYGGWGIYFDEGSSGILAENNIVIGTTHGGFHQHYGKENIVRNNVFAMGRDHQLQRSRAEDHISFTFEKNIVYFNRGKLFEGDWTGGKFRTDNNVYFDVRTNQTASLNFPGGWQQWRTNGHDAHSLISDPQFNSTNLTNLSLQKRSPALSLGFQPFSLKDVGPRQRKAR